MASPTRGLDIRCMQDADALFSETTYLEAVEQDAYHRLTTDNVLGPGGDGWGINCRRFVGMDPANLARQQARCVEVLLRDERITAAVIVLTATTADNGLADVQIDATITTPEGSFQFIKPVSELTNADITGQAS